MDTSGPPPLTPPECFYFCMKSIKPDYTIQPRRVSGPPYSLWMPPDEKAFELVSHPKWYFWCRGVVSEASSDVVHKIKTHRTTSMFWVHGCQAFLHIPVDCTEVAVKVAMGGPEKDMPLHWEKITFYHVEYQNKCLSVVGYRYEKEELGAKGSPDWMPQLLPLVYEPHGPTQYTESSQLAGDLSVLLSLAAFSTPPTTEVQTIGELLRRTDEGTVWGGDGLTGEGSKMESQLPKLEELNY